jgi:hypothetical protein
MTVLSTVVRVDMFAGGCTARSGPNWDGHPLACRYPKIGDGPVAWGRKVVQTSGQSGCAGANIGSSPD